MKPVRHFFKLVLLVPAWLLLALLHWAALLFTRWFVRPVVQKPSRDL